MLYREVVNLAFPLACDALRMHWGERLKTERLAQGRTGPEVGKAAGVTKAAVSLWENGGNIRPLHLFAVADYLKVSPRWLATGKGPKDPSSDLSDADIELLELFRKLSPLYQGMLLTDAHKYLAAYPPVEVDPLPKGAKH